MLTAERDRHGDRVASYFDRQSRDWPQQYESGLIADRCGRFVRALQAFVPARGRVLDIGCGSGEIAVRAATNGWRVVGCDISPKMLAVASARRDAARVSWVRLPRSERLPFLSGQFNAVFSSSVLEYVTDPDAHLAEGVRILGARGVYATTVPDMRHRIRIAEQSRTRVAHFAPAMALLRRTRWGPQFEYLLSSVNRWSLEEWRERFRHAGLHVADVPSCDDPLALLVATKA